MANKTLALVVLISGNGSNLQAIIDAIAANTLNAEIRAVISNIDDAYGLERARKAGIKTHLVEHRAFTSREVFDQALQQTINPYAPDLICLAGFMRRLGAEFVRHYANKIINIHPSLLPKYPGLNTHAKAIAAKDALHGATVHFVTEELDAGPIISQMETAVFADDTVASLKQRVQRLEHQLYPQTLQQLSCVM